MGVFTPSILTILGVVMYLRFGWVVGTAGIGQTLAVVTVAHLITFATALSISSIATNRTIRTGGAYYMISRSLGAPAGAAIGFPLFLGQALSITFYIVGFTESISILVPDLPVQWIGSGICVFLAALAFTGADIAIKSQLFVMAAIALSLVAFFTGGVAPQARPESIEYWRDGAFADVFKVFFPAVTGIMAGVGMSGDLRNPRTSLPRGTLLAVLVGFVIYCAVPLWLAFNYTNEQLRADPHVFWTISSVPALIYAGVWGATLSSAIASFLTAPRTLQALAFDRLAPRIFSRAYGKNREPRVGVLFTFVLAECGVLLGSLDAIAGLLTMFFLVTYGFTNVACGLERWAASPSFRPEFKFPAWVSLMGGIACFYVMSVINLLWMLAAFAICAAIWLVVQRRTLTATWGDARHGIWSALVRTSLYRLRRSDFHPQNWRPNLLVLGGGLKQRWHLIELGSAIVQDQGIVTYMNLLQGSVRELAHQRRATLKQIDKALAARFPHVFARVDIVDDLYRGVVTSAQSYGVGNFEANTVMLGWRKRDERFVQYAAMLRDLTRLDRSLVLVHFDEHRGLGRDKKIQIWWGGLQGNGSLMLLLAHLLTSHARWRKAAVEIIVVVDNDQEKAFANTGIREILESARVQASPRVIDRQGRGIRAIMKRESEGTDLAIVGMRIPERDEEVPAFHKRMNGLLSELPTTLLVHSSRVFQGEPVLFDDPEVNEAQPETAKPAVGEALRPRPPTIAD